MDVDDKKNLQRLADGMDKLVASIPKPANYMDRAIEIAITIVTLAGILSVIDIIKKWIGG